jgi:hypothetical protein
LLAAENVLNILMNDESMPHINANKLNVYVEAYQNGREQGFSISGLKGFKSISFSEHRNAGDIVVYFGTPSNQGLSVDAWKNSKHFPSRHYFEAAEYISQLIAENAMEADSPE